MYFSLINELPLECGQGGGECPSMAEMGRAVEG
jgi:hypothetical protein